MSVENIYFCVWVISVYISTLKAQHESWYQSDQVFAVKPVYL